MAQARALAIFWLVVLTGAVVTQNLALVAFWFISAVTVFWALFRIRMYSEHTGTTSTHRFRRMPLMEYAFFPHNTWLHFAHHKHPNIPFYRLLDHFEPENHTRSLRSLLSAER